MAIILEVLCSVSLASPRPCCVLAWGIFIPCMLSPAAGKDSRATRADWCGFISVKCVPLHRVHFLAFRLLGLPALLLSTSALLGLSPSLHCGLKTPCANKPRLVMEPAVSFLSFKHRSSELFWQCVWIVDRICLVSWLLVTEKQIWFLWRVQKGNKSRECLKSEPKRG